MTEVRALAGDTEGNAPGKASKPSAAQAKPGAAASGQDEEEEAEEGELEPGERAAGWESGPDLEEPRLAAEPAGPEGELPP